MKVNEVVAVATHSAQPTTNQMNGAGGYLSSKEDEDMKLVDEDVIDIQWGATTSYQVMPVPPLEIR